jgi:N5-(cytidine 5'-diphosphoramidyl)-L-glutamine hydrolase
MKKILLSQRLISHAGYPELREALDVKWGEFLPLCGLVPAPAPVRVPAETLFKEIRPDGVLLTGGNDLSSLNPDDPLCKLRDEFESALIRCAMEAKVPVLGVCRGMQMIAHTFGSELSRKAGHVGCEHPVRFTSGGPFAALYSESASVNSYHGFCVTRLGADLVAEGVAEADQTIEALIHRTLPIRGIMWHPERVEPFSKQDILFFRKSFKA